MMDDRDLIKRLRLQIQTQSNTIQRLETESVSEWYNARLKVQQNRIAELEAEVAAKVAFIERLAK